MSKVQPIPSDRVESALIYGLGLFVALLSILPLGRLLLEGIAPNGSLSAANFTAVQSADITWRATRNSLETAFGGTLLALIVGASVALLVTLTDIRARNAFVFVFVLPLMIAPQITALAWLQVFGPASPMLKMLGLAPPLGTKNPLYSREGIILLLGIQYAPLVFLTLRAGLRSLPRELIEAGLSSGAGRLTVLRTIILPLMTPPLVAGIALTFVSCIGNFGIPAFLGIPGRYPVLTTLIYQKLSGLGPSVLGEVSILSLLIGVIAMLGIVMQDYMLRRADYRITTTSLAARPFELRAARLPIEILLWALALFVVFLPFIGLLITSLVPVYGVPLKFANATLANYTYVLFEHAASRRAFFNSFSLSAGAALVIVALSVPLAYLIVWRRSRLIRFVSFAAELPYALPGVVLAIAAILIFLKPIPILGISIYNTVWIILIAYIARFLVLGVRPVISGMHQLDRALEEAAQVAGAGLVTRLRAIILPLVAPAAAAGGLLIFLTAFNELTVSALLWSSGSETLGVVVFSLEQGGDSTMAAALAVVSLLVTLGLMLTTLLFAKKMPQGVLPWRD